jgi:hypothetical protein
MTRAAHIQPFATGGSPQRSGHIHHSKILHHSLIGDPCSVFKNPSQNLSARPAAGTGSIVLRPDYAPHPHRLRLGRRAQPPGGDGAGNP